MASKIPHKKEYDETVKKVKSSLDNFLTKVINKLNKLTTKTQTFSNNNVTLTLEDNTVYYYNGNSGISKLTIRYPASGKDFISTIIFSTNSSGDIQVVFPKDSVFVGHKKLEFFNQEMWEINIHNKRVVAAQIYD